MAKNTTINLRVDSIVKEQAGEILTSMGLTFSEAFNLMLHQVRLQRALPFEVVGYSRMSNAKTLALIERIESGEEPLVGPFKTFEDFKASLEVEDDEI